MKMMLYGTPFKVDPQGLKLIYHSFIHSSDHCCKCARPSFSLTGWLKSFPDSCSERAGVLIKEGLSCQIRHLAGKLTKNKKGILGPAEPRAPTSLRAQTVLFDNIPDIIKAEMTLGRQLQVCHSVAAVTRIKLPVRRCVPASVH